LNDRFRPNTGRSPQAGALPRDAYKNWYVDGYGGANQAEAFLDDPRLPLRGLLHLR
jgi:hypothetical protein